MTKEKSSGEESPEGLIEAKLLIALGHLKEYRAHVGLPAQAEEKDLKLLRLLIEKKLVFGEDFDIGEGQAADSMWGNSGAPRDLSDQLHYNHAQIALIQAIEILERQEIPICELDYLGKGFAYIARDLIDLNGGDNGEPLEELVHIRDHTAFVAKIDD